MQPLLDAVPCVLGKNVRRGRCWVLACALCVAPSLRGEVQSSVSSCPSRPVDACRCIFKLFNRIYIILDN